MVAATWLLLLMLVVGTLGVASRWRPSRGDWPGLLLLAALIGVGAWLRFRLVPFHHAMYVDEPWYEEAARNLLRAGQLGIGCRQTGAEWECAEPYIKSAGWPAILAIAFRIAGATDHTAFFTSALLGVAAIPATAILTRTASGGWPQALLASALIAFLPVHTQWSTTAETNVAAVTLLLLGLGGTLLFHRERGLAALLVAVGGLGAAAAVRPELWLAFIPAAALLLRRSWTSLVVLVGAALAALPGIASRGAFSVHTKGELFRNANVGANFETWLTNYRELGRLSLLILLLALFGLYRLFRLKRRDAALLLGGTAILIGGFVLLYYPPAGFYSRTMLGALAPAAVLAGLYIPGGKPGVAWAWASVGVLAIGAWVWSTRDRWAPVPDSQLNETRLATLAREEPLPGVLIAEQPSVFEALSDLTVQDADSYSGATGGDVYLACDMYCEPGFGGGDGKSACRKLLRDYVVEPFRVIDSPHRNYGFYRIVRRSETPIEEPICPMVPRRD